VGRRALIAFAFSSLGLACTHDKKAAPAGAPDAATAPTTGAGTVARPPAPPIPIVDDGHGHELGPEGRPVVECPVADRLAVVKMLDAAAARYEKGEFEVALACADRVVAIDPRNVEAHHDRAIALAALHRWDAAKQAFALALAIDPDDPETLAAAADFYVNRLAADRDHTIIGLEYAQRGSQKVPGRDRELASELALIEAQALDDLGRSDDALPRAEAAVQLDPDNLNARYEKAAILFHLCRFDASRRAFADVLARAPGDAFAHHHMGLILEREGRLAEAEAHFTRAQELAPDKFPAPVLLPPGEFQGLVDTVIKELDAATQKMLDGVAVEIADIPALEDLTAVDPPFAPTILGLYRGPPVGQPGDEARAIVLYRKNLARAVTTRGELDHQVRITLWHEIGHLMGRDEEDLRQRGLE
jgi:tetratricopeptide (TPR) repeat protein